MKEECRGGKADLLSGCQLVASPSSGLTLSASVSECYDERVTRQAVRERLCVCLCGIRSVVSSGGMQARLG